MRRRSTTIHAETYDEYIDLCKEEDNRVLSRTATFPRQNHLSSSKREISSDRRAPTRSYLDVLTEVKDDEDDDWSDFYYENRHEAGQTPNELKRSPSTACIISPQESAIDVPDSTPSSETTSLHKIMIIGTMKSGRHSLINTLFEEKISGNPDIRNALDLVTKSRVVGSVEQKFKFWIQDPTEEKLDPLIRVYLKSINTYIFIYNLTNRKSFEALDTAIQKTKSQIDQENFFGILIGNFSDQEQSREVTYEEGLKLSKKYNLGNFFETNCYDDTIRHKIFQLIR